MASLVTLVPAAVAGVCMTAAYLWVGAGPTKDRVLVGAVAAVVMAVAVVLMVSRWLPDDDSESMMAFGFVMMIGVLAIWFGRYYSAPGH